jgi:hypothetical protein
MRLDGVHYCNKCPEQMSDALATAANDYDHFVILKLLHPVMLIWQNPNLQNLTIGYSRWFLRERGRGKQFRFSA